MRVSTAGMHSAALAAILERSTALLKTQNQIATGKRIQTPADDPAGAVRALDLDRAIAESEQYGRNAQIATNRLTLEEQTMADAASLLQRVRDLTLQANNATTDFHGRQAIAKEIQSRLEELTALANRKDANGEYLFAGFSSLTKPFVLAGNTVTYVGDQGVRLLQTSPTQHIADGHSGFHVFMNVPEGNGTFVTGAAPTNTGSGAIDTGSVTDPTAWVPDSYTLTFTTATDWEITDGSGTVVATGTHSPGDAINFNGVQVTITGAPAAGDVFTIEASGKEDMFTTLGELITTLGRQTLSPSERALFNTEMGGVLTQIDSALDHISGVRAEIGARLRLLDDEATSRLDREMELKSSLSQLRDLDYAEAITRLNVQLTGLQAAQASYQHISQLSLFSYL